MAKPIHFDFMALRKVAMFVSLVLVLVSLVSLAIKQLNLGLDFVGGLAIELHYPDQPDLAKIRAKLAEAGYERVLVQSFGNANNLLIRLPDITPNITKGNQSTNADVKGTAIAGTNITSTDTVGTDIIRLVQESNPEAVLVASDFIGAQFGKELKEQGTLGLIVALIMVMLYIAFRFQFKFSLAAVAALLHDVIIILGVFSLFGLNFDLNVLVALLVVIGYSLNDTIVISDRIRENFRKLRKTSALDIINISVNQTLGRTAVTSFTTLLVLVVLVLFGGQAIYYLALALIIGVIAGTYSSVYIAGTLMLWMKLDRQDLVLPQEQDDVNRMHH